MTISQAIDAFEPVDAINIPETITWADTERDLSAWLGNPMQQEAIKALYDMQSVVLGTNDPVIIEIGGACKHPTIFITCVLNGLMMATFMLIYRPL